MYVNKVKAIVNDSESMEGALLPKGKNTYTFTKDTYENKHTPYCASISAGGCLAVLESIINNEI